MAATIFIPTPLRKVTGGQAKIQVPASTIQEAIESADRSYPGFKERVMDNNGEIKRFINVFVNGVDVRQLEGRSTWIRDGDEVAVIPAMAGGETQQSSPVIVSAEWVGQHLEDPAIRLLDVRVADPRLPVGYRMGHIPNAVPFDLERDLFEMGHGMPRMKSPEAIAQMLGGRGISNDAAVVLYDEDTGPLAGLVFWLLKYLGHGDVRVLSGGWAAWKQSRGPVTHDIPQVQPKMYIAHADANQRGSADWIQDCSSRPDVVLLDARSDAEYYMGHIPGAVNLSFDSALDYGTAGLKSPEVLRQQFEEVGVTPDKEVVTYCASGSRSAHTYLVLKYLGYPRVRNYDGSMMDWSQRRGLPVE